MRSLFRKFKEGLKRQTPFQKAFSGVFSGAKIDADALEELEGSLHRRLWPRDRRRNHR